MAGGKHVGEYESQTWAGGTHQGHESHFGGMSSHFNWTRNARFYARAVQLANWGALTRIILSGVLLSKF